MEGKGDWRLFVANIKSIGASDVEAADKNREKKQPAKNSITFCSAGYIFFKYDK